MVLIPGGYFQRGSTNGLLSEAPAHPVLLDAFYPDVYEVSNEVYTACVAGQACHIARIPSSFTRTRYRDSPDDADYPVIGVTGDDVHAYCDRAGKRLPTEAEWEDGASAPDTQPFGNYVEGVSPFEAYNLAGIVAEWVADVYSADCYGDSPPLNLLASGAGDYRLYRGGSFGNRDPLAYTTSRRIAAPRTLYEVAIGFRCALDAPEMNTAERLEAMVGEFGALYAAYRPEVPCP